MSVQSRWEVDMMLVLELQKLLDVAFHKPHRRGVGVRGFSAVQQSVNHLV